MQERREFPFDEKLFFVDHCKRMQHEAEEGLRIALQVTDDVWADFIKEVREAEAYTRNVLLKKKRTNFFHDPKIPKELSDRTCALLEKYSIEPTSIDIKMSNDNSYTAGVKQSPVTILYPGTQQLNEFSLNLNANALQILSIDGQEAILIHEIGHLLHADNFIVNKFLTENFRFFSESDLKKTEFEAISLCNNPNFLEGTIQEHNTQSIFDKKINRLVNEIKFVKEYLDGFSKINPFAYLFGYRSYFNKEFSNKVSILLLLKKMDKTQIDCINLYYERHREYIADQYIVSRDATMINKLTKQFYLDFKFDPLLQHIDRSHESYPSYEERILSFAYNIVRPRYYLHFLARFFDESSI